MKSKQNKRTRFSPKHQYQMRWMRGNTVLATIDRQRDGSHFVFIRDDHRGWICRTLVEAQKSIQVYFLRVSISE